MTDESWTPWVRRKQILGEIEEERARQIVLWGVQGHDAFDRTEIDFEENVHAFSPLYTVAEQVADLYGIPRGRDAKRTCQDEARNGDASWTAIVVEELAEAVEEAALGDLVALRTELVQTAAVVVAWIEDLDRAAAQVREDDIESAYVRILQKGSE